MKFFSLLYETEIHPAPGSKIVCAESFSRLVEATEMIALLQEEIKRSKQEAAEEGERLYQKSKEEGFKEGLSQWNKQLEVLENERINVRKEVEKIVVPLALKAAQKIVGREISLNPETTADIVLQALRAVSQHKRVAIYVHKNDLEILEKNKPKLKAFLEHVESLSLQERPDIEPGGCVIETEAGIINAQLENQWNALETAFQSLINKEA